MIVECSLSLGTRNTREEAHKEGWRGDEPGFIDRGLPLCMARAQRSTAQREAAGVEPAGQGCR